ncbi:MAG TPA: transposase [Ktedonobacterales bacterium]|nr:transposase [Ktedonobacterales bacterium]
METQRAITILLPDDADLRATLAAFRAVQNAVSETAFNGGKPLRAVELQRVVYEQVKGMLSSQMTITALRLVAGAYASAKRNYSRRVRAEAQRKARYETKGWMYKPRHIKPVGVCTFTHPAAMFLVGERGRDADFRADGTLSIWTVAGRKRLSFRVPPALRPLFDAAKEIDSVTVIERTGKLYGRVALTLEAPEPKGVVPVGIDLNETNAMVAVDADGRAFFQSGKATKVRNRRTMQTTKRVQRTLATKKAEGRDTRSVRRVLKRLSGRRRRRTQDFARVVAKQLVAWAPADSVLVFEDLQQMQPPARELTRGVALRRRLALWQHGAIRRAVASKAQLAGLAIASVNPAYTSQNCSRCGLRGKRRRHQFACPACGHTQHADVNAAINIRNRYVQSRLDGAPSIAPEALPQGEGKLPLSSGSH